MEYVPCIGNSSYSFWWILLKLYRCFKDGLEICILFFQNPEIIFYHFFRIFNLDISRALILQICIWSIYLVLATPPTVFGESFWNFTVVFRMVWRYAYCFLRILKLFFLHFNLDIFSSLYAVNVWKKKAKAAFLWFHMRNLSLAGYNCSGGASCMACSFIYKGHYQQMSGCRGCGGLMSYTRSNSMWTPLFEHGFCCLKTVSGWFDNSFKQLWCKNKEKLDHPILIDFVGESHKVSYDRDCEISLLPVHTIGK